MRAMTWVPIPLADGHTLAHIVIPTDLARSEADILMRAIYGLLPPPAKPEPAKQVVTPSPEPAASRPTSALDQETRSVVDTATAAHYLNRRPQTLRTWACLENGPLRPLRINGRLAWPVAELRRCVSVRA